MRQSRWLTAVAAIVLCVALPGGALLGCVTGPTDSAMAQMACCKHGHQACGTSVSARACCETGDHSNQNTLAKSLSGVDLIRKLPLATRVGVPLSEVPLRSWVLARPVATMFAGTTSPPRFAFSVLLI
jgi:hypothetical protein